VSKTRLGTPADNASGARGIHAAAQLFARFCRSVLRRQIPARYFLQEFVEAVYTGLDAGPDVVDPGWSIMLQSEYVRARYKLAPPLPASAAPSWMSIET
jgi:hypothetical protein